MVFTSFEVFCSGIVKDSVLLRYDTASKGNQILTCPGNLVTLSSRVTKSLDILILESVHQGLITHWRSILSQNSLTAQVYSGWPKNLICRPTVGHMCTCSQL